MFKKMQVLFLTMALCLIGATSAFAAFTVPALPVDNMEAAGVAVAGLVAGYVLLRSLFA